MEQHAALYYLECFEELPTNDDMNEVELGVSCVLVVQEDAIHLLLIYHARSVSALHTTYQYIRSTATQLPSTKNYLYTAQKCCLFVTYVGAAFNDDGQPLILTMQRSGVLVGYCTNIDSYIAHRELSITGSRRWLSIGPSYLLAK